MLYPRHGYGWQMTKLGIKEMMDEGEIGTPEEYGFTHLQDMYDFMRGRAPYEENRDFRPNYGQDYEEQNRNEPQGIDWEKSKELLED